MGESKEDTSIVEDKADDKSDNAIVTTYSRNASQ